MINCCLWLECTKSINKSGSNGGFLGLKASNFCCCNPPALRKISLTLGHVLNVKKMWVLCGVEVRLILLGYVKFFITANEMEFSV